MEMINATYRKNWQSNLRQSNARYFLQEKLSLHYVRSNFLFFCRMYLVTYYGIFDFDFSAVRFPNFTLANLSIKARKYKQRPNNVYCKEKLNVLDEYSTIK